MQKLQISIPKPCHENWQNMTATEQGRFCKACAKEVVDFSTMTDTEVLNYFTTITHNNVCGRVLTSQLNRPITYPMQIKKKMYWYWNYIVMFFMFFAKSNAVKAQGKLQEVPVAQNPVKRSSLPNGEVLVTRVGGIKQVSSKIIDGIVTDENRHPIPNATILIKGTKNGVVTNAKGLFSIRVLKDAVLMVSAMGYQNSSITVNEEDYLTIQLNTDFSNVVLGGISFTGLKNEDDKIVNNENTDTTGLKKVKQLDTVKVKAAYPTTRGEITVGLMGAVLKKREKISNKNETKLKTIKTTNTMKVYPNPAIHGNNIQLNMNLKETGLYQLQVTDAVYRTVFYKRINAVNKQQNEQIVCDSKWASGIYFIRIFDSKNSLVNESSFIVQ